MTGVGMSRRTVLASGLGAVALAAIGTRGAAAAPFGSGSSARPGGAAWAYVGCYTSTEREGHGNGIAVFRVDPSGRWDPIQVLATVDNPSYLITDRAATTLYSVHGDGDTVGAYRIDPATGHISELARQNTGGTNGVHLELSPDERWLVVANYATGSIAVFPRAADGSLGLRSQLLELTGTAGPLPEDQKGPQPHQVHFAPTGTHLIVPDKGTDRLHRLAFDPAVGTVSVLAEPILTAPGTGPRHLAYHPYLPAFYLVDELSSQVTVYFYDRNTAGAGAGTSLSTLPDEAQGPNTASAIALSADGRFVLVSNRGHDTIATYAISPVGSLLSPTWTPTQGKQPRFITFDPAGTTVYAANQKTDTIIPFTFDPISGRLDQRGEAIGTGSPSCIVFVPAP